MIERTVGKLLHSVNIDEGKIKLLRKRERERKKDTEKDTKRQETNIKIRNRLIRKRGK